MFMDFEVTYDFQEDKMSHRRTTKQSKVVQEVSLEDEMSEDKDDSVPIMKYGDSK